MDTLPIFFGMIKNNLILHAFIFTGGFSQISQNNYKYTILSDSSIVIENFSLSSDDCFRQAVFIVSDDVKTIILSSNDRKYYEMTNYYFGEDENSLVNRNSYMSWKRKKRKDIGFFSIFDSPIPKAEVTVYLEQDGCRVHIDFNKKYQQLEEIRKMREKALLDADVKAPNE